jgi:SAM-dependent methyltransferase
MAAGLMQLYELDGSVLDVGCNTGYVLNCLATQFGCHGVGFDRNVKCIETARDVRFGEECSFLACSDEDLALSRVFDLVICATVGLPTKRILNLASRHLSEKGMLLLIESGWDVKALGAEARDFGLRLIHCEVIGGYDLLAPKDGVPYGALVATVIAGEKALARRYPIDAPGWSLFAAYANSGDFPKQLHTQSHFLANLYDLGSEATL